VDTTVLHLLTPGDGSDGVLRVAAVLSAAARPAVPDGSADARFRHRVARVGADFRPPYPAELAFDDRFPAGWAMLAANRARLIDLVGRAGVRLIHTWGPDAAELVSLAAQALPQVAWVASDLPVGWAPPPLGAQPPVRLTPGCADDGRSGAGAPPSPVPLPARPTRAEARARLKIPDDAPTLVFTAPLSPQTNLLTAAWGCSVAAQVYRNLHVVAVGHGPSREKWEGLLARGTIAGRARHLPRAADWPVAFAAADLALDTEPGPNVSAPLATALAAGLATLVPDTPARRALLDTTAFGPTAEFCRPDEPRDYARLIHRLLSEPAVAGSLGSAAGRLAAGWPAWDPTPVYHRQPAAAG
jgi:glycosyltransferase involved in cell wall biosynthesis